MIIHVPLHLTLANKLYLSSKIEIDPLIVSTKNVFGLYIYNMLSKSPIVSKSGDDMKMDSGYSERVILEIPELIFYRKGIHVSNRANHTFNLFVKKMMLEDFHRYMDFHFLLNRVQLRQAIWDWMQRSNLYEDALALRTLEKDYERYRKPKKQDELRA